jgi:translation elongation factor P/translation initiation factor 5A
VESIGVISRLQVQQAGLSEALSFLSGGMRGYYATYRGDPVTVRLGERVLRC